MRERQVVMRDIVDSMALWLIEMAIKILNLRLREKALARLYLWRMRLELPMGGSRYQRSAPDRYGRPPGRYRRRLDR